MPFRGFLRQKKERGAQTSLIDAAISLLELLDEVDDYPALYLNHTILQHALFRYEHRWVPLLACIPPSERLFVMPPLDVHWVWLCHMLNPVEYIRDSAAMWQTLRPEETAFVIDHHLPPSAERQDARRRAALMWTELFPDESFDMLQTLSNAPVCGNGERRNARTRSGNASTGSRITYDIIAAAERQMAFHYQVTMPHHRDLKYLKHSVHRYRDMFLKMFRKFPGEIWVPTYDIDLIWHVHMMHPRWYREHTTKQCGNIVPHDDMFNDRSYGSQLNTRWVATMSQWKKMFKSEPIVREGGMWRGSITVKEQIERTRIHRYMQNVENRIVTIARRSTRVRYAEANLAQLSFTIVYGNGATLSKMQPNRVHAFEWHTANRAAAKVTNGKPNKFEGVTYLKCGDHPNLLACRTLHFLKYDLMNRPYDYGTILEVFGVGVSSDIPLATAHYVYPCSICTDKTTACSQKSDEVALLLRVAGEDYGILFGRWENFKPPLRATEDVRKDQHGQPGRLELAFWKLGKHSVGYRQSFHRVRSDKEPGMYKIKLPIAEKDGTSGTSSITFDIKETSVCIENASHAVVAFLISMASAALHVTLQPRFAPNSWNKKKIDSTSFPEWSYSQESYDMLRGTGGDFKGPCGYEGFWNMVLLSLQSTPFRDFVGSIHELRAPEGAVPGGCGGCGGGELDETGPDVDFAL